MKNEEFYIGWMSAAPNSFAKHIRIVVSTLVILVCSAAIVLAMQQRKFSTAVFEYGQLTEVTGTYQAFPVPSLKVRTKQDIFGNSTFITMPLVGYGKFGAEGVISELEYEYSSKFNNREITLKGTLIHHDGKTLLQIDKNDKPLINLGEQVIYSAATRQLGLVKLTGEIIDPKCYFGVMKPGHGKPHRDCAVRCVAGGISPVFYVRNEKGEANYYLILDEIGKRMNQQIMNFIADPVTLEARAVQHDDWVILYVKTSSVKRTGGLSWFKMGAGNISCGKN